MKNLLLLSALAILSPVCAFAWPEFLGGKPPVLSVEDYKWVGEKPSEALFQNLYKVGVKDNFIFPEKGTTFTRFTIADKPILIKAFKNNFHVIEPTSELEKALLVESKLNSKPHEVGKVFVKTDGKEWISQLFHGDGDSLKIDFSRISYPLYKKVYSGEIEVVEATFIHTHPVIEFHWKDKNGKREVFLGGLSPDDIALAEQISLMNFPGVPFRIKAVTAEGYTYSKIFKSGKDITLKSLSDDERQKALCYMDE